jgi:hypothetical protein
MHKIFLARSTEELAVDPFLRFGELKLFAIPGLFILPGEVTTSYSVTDEMDDDQRATEYAGQYAETDNGRDDDDAEAIVSQMTTTILDTNKKTINVRTVGADSTSNEDFATVLSKSKKRAASTNTQASKQITSVNTEWRTIMDSKKKKCGRKVTMFDKFDQGDYEVGSCAYDRL